jgi:hypothetical protein
MTFNKLVLLQPLTKKQAFCSNIFYLFVQLNSQTNAMSVKNFILLTKILKERK